ncbi:hypothetical protein Tco_1554098 [Tanacetum coccineum]
MSTLVFVDPESSTQADGAQSSRVPVPLPEDPYEAIRQAYLVGTDTESEPIEDLGTESPESPHTVVSPVGHVEESENSETSWLWIHPTMSSGCSARIAEVATMSDVAFRKRFRSPYESSPSPSPTLPVWKRYRGTSELVLSTDSEADELGDEEDSLDSDSGSEGAENEGHAAGDEDPDMRDEGFGLGEDEAVPEGQQRAAPVVETAVGEPLGLGYGALRRRELAAEDDQRYSMFEVGQGSGYAPELERLERVSAFRQPTLTTWTDPEDAPISSPLISLTVSLHVATPTATILVDEDQFIEVGAQLELYGSMLQDHTQRLDALPPTLFAKIDRDVRELYTRSGAVRDEIFSQRYRLRSLEQEQERAVITFRALWRPVLALEAWAGHVDTRMTSMSRAGYDDHRLVHDLLVQQAALQREL